ncbi:MAG: hypothetical protein ACOX1N_04175 [Candidatus Methanomethylophilaceae archaeon]
MSKKGAVSLLVVAVLIAAGAGVYFLYGTSEGDSALFVKESFKVGDRHTTIDNYRSTVEVIGMNESNEFNVLDRGEPDVISYEYMGCFKKWLIESEDVVDDAYKTGNERIVTAFGERDCTVYFRNYDWIAVKYYIGENNGAAYRIEREHEAAKEVHVIEAADMYNESNDIFELKDPQEIKAGDKFIAHLETKMDFKITEIKPAEGNNPELYRTSDDSEYITREKLLNNFGISAPNYLRNEYELKGTVSVDTPLGKIECDNYANDEDLGPGSFVYVSNGIYVKSGSDLHLNYWTYSDFIEVKNLA